MDDDERRDESEEMNEENDAREEDIVEDEDADTRDIEDSESEEHDEISRRMDSIEEMLGRVLGKLDALTDAQSIMVDNGATIMEDIDDSLDLGIDDYEPPAELDLTID